MKKLLCALGLLYSFAVCAGDIDMQRDRYHSDFLPRTSYVTLSTGVTNDYDHEGEQFNAEGGVVTPVGMFVAGYGQENARHRNFAFPYILPDTSDADKYDYKDIELHTMLFGWGIDTDRAENNSFVAKFSDLYQFKASIGWGRSEGTSDDFEGLGSRRQDARALPLEFFMRKKGGMLEGVRLGVSHTPYRYHETGFSYDFNAAGITLWEYKKDSWFTGRTSEVKVDLPVASHWDFIFSYNQDRVKEYSHNFSEHEDPLGIYATSFYYPNFGQSSLLRRYESGVRYYFDEWTLSAGALLHSGSTSAAVDAVAVRPSESLGIFAEARFNGETAADDSLVGLRAFQIRGENSGRTLPYYGTLIPTLGTAQDLIRRRTAQLYYRTFSWEFECNYSENYDRSIVTYDPVQLFTISNNTWKDTRYGLSCTYRYTPQWIVTAGFELGRTKTVQHYPDAVYNTHAHRRNTTTTDMTLSITRRF